MMFQRMSTYNGTHIRRGVVKLVILRIMMHDENPEKQTPIYRAPNKSVAALVRWNDVQWSFDVAQTASGERRGSGKKSVKMFNPRGAKFISQDIKCV